MVINYNLVRVEDPTLFNAMYPKYKGAEFVLAETGYIHLGFFTRSVKLATSQKILQMELHHETPMELSYDQVKPFLDGKVTAQGLADLLNSSIMEGDVKKPITDNKYDTKTTLKELSDCVEEKQTDLDSINQELKQDPDNEELKKAKQSAQGKLNYANTQLKKFKEENEL